MRFKNSTLDKYTEPVEGDVAVLGRSASCEVILGDSAEINKSLFEALRERSIRKTDATRITSKARYDHDKARILFDDFRTTRYIPEEVTRVTKAFLEIQNIVEDVID
jgi:hypothetical protein